MQNKTMNTDFDRGKSLQELEQQDWGEPNFDSSLVTTCHRLRRKPISQFSVEDLRIMIGQQIGLPFLVPLALERLEADPMAEGDFYRGDLLCAVARVSDDFWTSHPDALDRVRKIVARIRELPATPGNEDLQSMLRKLAGS
jgi:hypothetical protein